MPGIDLEDIMAGISICRNQDLSNVFCRLRLIEAYGTGASHSFNTKIWYVKEFSGNVKES